MYCIEERIYRLLGFFGAGAFLPLCLAFVTPLVTTIFIENLSKNFLLNCSHFSNFVQPSPLLALLFVTF